MQIPLALLFLQSVTAGLTATASKDTKPIVLLGKSFSLDVDLTFSLPIPETVSWVAKESNRELAKGEFNTTTEGALISKTTLAGFTLDESRYYSIQLEFREGNSTEMVSNAPVGIRCVPGFVTLIPVVLTLFLAFWTHQVLLSLAFGVWLALSIVEGGNVFTGFLRTLDTFFVKSLADADHVKVVLFTWFLSMMVALVVRSGGAKGLAVAFKGLVSNRYTAQWATLLLGVVIFFDDYASALIVGHNMRLVTDSVKLSHEKLAFIVHSTAAGPASLAPISSWIGYELGLLKDSLPATYSMDAFQVFIQSIPSRFYPLFVLFIIAFSAGLRRDFGPMLQSERRAESEGLLVPADDSLAKEVNGDEEEPLVEKADVDAPGKEPKWYNAVIPLLFMLVAVVVGLFMSGYYAQLAEKVPDLSVSGLAGSGNSYDALVWASFGSVVVSVLLYTIQKVLTLKECMDTMVDGVKDITEALLVLTLAWSISNAFKTIMVPEFIVSGLGENISTTVLPALVFAVSCIISFATGTSWGTMAIVMPLSIPLALAVGKEDTHVVVLVASAVLTGSIFGDQCSPISDTSILSALSSEISVVRHVESQLPYAVMCAFFAFIAYFPTSAFTAIPSIVFTLVFAFLLGGAFFLISSKVESEDLGIIDRFLYKKQSTATVEKI